MLACLSEDLRAVDLLFIKFPGEATDHLFNDLVRGLKVKQKAIRAPLIRKCLTLRLSRRCQRHRAAGQIKHIAVPMISRERAFNFREQPVRACRFC